MGKGILKRSVQILSSPIQTPLYNNVTRMTGLFLWSIDRFIIRNNLSTQPSLRTYIEETREFYPTFGEMFEIIRSPERFEIDEGYAAFNWAKEESNRRRLNLVNTQ